MVNKFISYLKYEIINRGNVVLASRCVGAPKSQQASELFQKLTSEEQTILAGEDFKAIQDLFDKYFEDDNTFIYLHQIRNSLRSKDVRDTGLRFDRVEAIENNDFPEPCEQTDVLYNDPKLSYVRRVYLCDLVLRKLNQPKHSWEELSTILGVCKTYNLYLRGKELRREQVITNLLGYKLLKAADKMEYGDPKICREISDWANLTCRPIKVTA